MTDSGMRRLLAAVRGHHAGTATPAELEACGRARLRALAGGRNSGVYAASLDGRRLCLKLPIVDERGRAEREWRALWLLAAQLPGLAPAPLLHDPHPSQPVVVMSLLPGGHLGARRLDRHQLAMLAEVHALLQEITPAAAAAPLPAAVGQPADLMRRVDGCLDTAPSGRGAPWRLRAARLWREWRAGPDPTVLLAPAPQVLSRGDPSLANCLWDGRRLTIVDFEYAGWRDRAVELADLVEHAQARNTTAADWDWFVGRFDFDAHELARHRAARRLLAFFWLTLALAPPRPGREPADLQPAPQLRHITALLGPRG